MPFTSASAQGIHGPTVPHCCLFTAVLRMLMSVGPAWTVPDASICVKIAWSASSCRVAGAGGGLCVGGGVGVHRGGEGAVELAGDVSLDAAPDLAVGFAFSAAAGQVVLGFGVVAHSGVGDDVDGLVECSVPASVESVAGGLAAGGLERAGSGEFGEGGIVAAAPGVGERDDGLGGADRADSGAGGQLRDQVVDDCGQFGAVGLERASGLAQRQSEPADLGGRTACCRLAPAGWRRRSSPARTVSLR